MKADKKVDKKAYRLLWSCFQEMELEKEVICGKVQEKFHISSQEAAQEVEKYWK